MPDREIRNIAIERIRILFRLAEQNIVTKPELADRYVELARKIASRNRVHIPQELKRRVCHGCKKYLSPINSHTRIRQARVPHIAITCHNCGHINRIPLRRR
jgi:ribonuclease P protein subunit RPR2